MFYIEGYDRFSYEWFFIGQYNTKDEAEKRLQEKRSEEERMNGKYNPIGNVYFLRESIADLESAPVRYS